MFSELSNLITGMDIIETDSTITIAGINGYDVSRMASRIWKTSVIETYMFKTIRGTKIEFYKFFAVDVLYMLEKMASLRDPRLPVRKIRGIVELLKERSWLKEALNENMPGRLDFSKLDLFTFTPKEYQTRFFEYYDKIPTRYRLKGALLNAAPGAGKSFTSAVTLEMANVDRIIIIAPKNAVDRVWFNDPMQFYKKPPKIWNTTMKKSPDPDTKLFVYHYEALDLAFAHHGDEFTKYNYGIIIDESHNFNDLKSQRTQKLVELCSLSNSNNIIFSSGTPFKALGSESIPLFKILDPMFNSHAEERYRKIYGSSAQRGLDILQNRLGIVSFIVKKEELGLDKPIMESMGIKVKNGKRFTLSVIKEEMKQYISERYLYYKSREEKDMAFYKECLSIYERSIGADGKERYAYNTYLEYVKEIQRTPDISKITDKTSYCKKFEFYTISPKLPKEYVKEFRSVCSVIKYLTLKIQGECLGNIVGKRRIEAHQAMCEAIPFYDICNSTAKKTVVFTSFVDVLQDAYNACKKQGLNPILVYGKTNNNLSGLVKQFEQDGKVNPLIATYDSLSTAVPLVMADTMIMINAPFRAYIQEQAISRIHRLRQDSQTKVYQLYLDTDNEPNISSRSLDIMTWSQQQVEQITGVKSPYTLEDNDDGVKISGESFDEGLNYNVLPLKDGVMVFEDKPKTVVSRAEW